MGRVVDTMGLIKKTRGTINTYYDASFQNFIDIINSSEGNFDLLSNGFTFGYVQGMKAAKAEMRKS